MPRTVFQEIHKFNVTRITYIIAHLISLQFQLHNKFNFITHSVSLESTLLSHSYFRCRGRDNSRKINISYTLSVLSNFLEFFQRRCLFRSILSFYRRFLLQQYSRTLWNIYLGQRAATATRKCETERESLKAMADKKNVRNKM